MCPLGNCSERWEFCSKEVERGSLSHMLMRNYSHQTMEAIIALVCVMLLQDVSHSGIMFSHWSWQQE